MESMKKYYKSKAKMLAERKPNEMIYYDGYKKMYYTVPVNKHDFWMNKEKKIQRIVWRNLNWVLALVIIIIGSLGLPYIFGVSENSAFFVSSLVSFLYLVGVNR